MTGRTPRIALVAALAAAACGAPVPDAPSDEGAAPEAPASSVTDLPPGTEVPEGVEAISFLGDTLRAPELSERAREVYQARYDEAQAVLEENPEDVEALIWMGRRTAYLGWYRDAIALYTHALTLHPDDARLHRHRGHRYISVRELDRAVADFERAAALVEGRPDEVEPDGLPNAAGIPLSTLQFNIWYHLALTHYLAGDFPAAAEGWAECARVAANPDSEVACAYWRYMTLRRLGRDEEAGAVLAAVPSELDLVENDGYHDLLLLFKGERTPEDLLGPTGSDATLAGTTATYGVGMWYLLEGDAEEAERLFRLNRTGADQWAAFGYIASEAELAGLGSR